VHSKMSTSSSAAQRLGSTRRLSQRGWRRVANLKRSLKIMNWNHRIIANEVGGETSYNIHEVYYDGNQPTSWTEKPISPYGDSLQEIRGDYDLMRRAFFRPVLRVFHNGDRQVLVADDTDLLPVDEYHRHEALDRAAVFADQFESHVASHPAIATDADLRSQAEDIVDRLCNLYQAIGRIQPTTSSEQGGGANRAKPGGSP